jgi:hypothetical protein
LIAHCGATADERSVEGLALIYFIEFSTAFLDTQTETIQLCICGAALLREIVFETARFFFEGSNPLNDRIDGNTYGPGTGEEPWDFDHFFAPLRTKPQALACFSQ